MSWKAIARSATGTSHLKQQIPCQDYGGCKVLDRAIIGAVADGAGSAIHADVGAKLAVDTVLECLTKENFSGLPPDEEEARGLFTQVVRKVIATLEAQAISQGYAIAELSCTLLAFIATPTWVAAMQIGDGFIVLRCQHEQPQLLFSPDKGEYINETTFVTSATALAGMKVDVRSHQPEFICAATDGLERVAIRMSDWTPFTPFFQPLEQYLREASDLEQEDEYLIHFLDSDRLNARTDDDKTLLLCCYDDSSNSR